MALPSAAAPTTVTSTTPAGAAAPSSTTAADENGETKSESTKITPKKRTKRKRAPKTFTLNQFTIRHPLWAYIHLSYLSPSPTPQAQAQAQASQSSLTAVPPPLDALTAHLHLTAALSQFLGLHGSAIPIDVLNLEGQDVWIRVPNEDRSAVVAAAGGWMGKGGQGWRVQGWSSWDAAARGRDAGQGLFND